MKLAKQGTKPANVIKLGLDLPRRETNRGSHRTRKPKLRLVGGQRRAEMDWGKMGNAEQASN